MLALGAMALPVRTLSSGPTSNPDLRSSFHVSYCVTKGEVSLPEPSSISGKVVPSAAKAVWPRQRRHPAASLTCRT